LSQSCIIDVLWNLFDLHKQLGDWHLQGVRKALHHGDGWVTRTALDAANVRTINPELEGELLLTVLSV
jgi:hypothetical protein